MGDFNPWWISLDQTQPSTWINPWFEGTSHNQPNINLDQAKYLHDVVEKINYGSAYNKYLH